jgi:hypothetical protein
MAQGTVTWYIITKYFLVGLCALCCHRKPESKECIHPLSNLLTKICVSIGEWPIFPDDFVYKTFPSRLCALCCHRKPVSIESIPFFSNLLTKICVSIAEWPIFPDDFVYKVFPIPPMDLACIRTYERFDYFKWANHLFCTPDNKKDPLFDWSDGGPKPDMKCVRIFNPVETKLRRNTWDNNYLCAPKNVPYKWVINEYI